MQDFFSYSWCIAKKELKSLLVLRSTYIIAGAMLLLSAYFFFSILGSFNLQINQLATLPFEHPKRAAVNLNQSVVEPYFYTVIIMFLFVIPILSMRFYAGEKQMKTYELLLTSGISIPALVVGKFLGLLFVVIALLVPILSFSVMLCIFANPEVVPIVVGMIGVLLTLSAFAALSLLCSAVSQNQLVAGTTSLLLLLFLYGLNVPKSALGSIYAAVISAVSPIWHLKPVLAGVLTLEALIYFSFLVLSSLWLTSYVVADERWRQSV